MRFLYNFQRIKVSLVPEKTRIHSNNLYSNDPKMVVRWGPANCREKLTKHITTVSLDMAVLFAIHRVSFVQATWLRIRHVTYRRLRLFPEKCVLGITLNCMNRLSFSFGNLGSEENALIAITPKSTPARGGSTR